jgi:hypothetical protein
MNNSSVFVSKIQHLLVSYLLKNGSIDLLLPDGIKLEIGIIQENSEGELVINVLGYLLNIKNICGHL